MKWHLAGRPVTPTDLALFAGIPADETEAVIWGATGFPCFFSPRRGSVARTFWLQLWRAARLHRRGWLGDYMDWGWDSRRCVMPWRPPLGGPSSKADRGARGEAHRQAPTPEPNDEKK